MLYTHTCIHNKQDGLLTYKKKQISELGLYFWVTRDLIFVLRLLVKLTDMTHISLSIQTCSQTHLGTWHTAFSLSSAVTASSRGSPATEQLKESSVCPLSLWAAAENNRPWERCNFSLSHGWDSRPDTSAPNSYSVHRRAPIYSSHDFYIRLSAPLGVLSAVKLWLVTTWDMCVNLPVATFWGNEWLISFDKVRVWEKTKKNQPKNESLLRQPFVMVIIELYYACITLS